mgnify:CR=1 FL=1|jgi:hypothetical protein
MATTEQGPTIRVRGRGATSRQRRLVTRAWQRWWAQYTADDGAALVFSTGDATLVSCGVPQ